MYASKLSEVKNNYNNGSTTNKYTCHCKKCGRVLLSGEGVRIIGGYNGGGFLCERDARMVSYHGGTDTQTGTTKSHGFIISPELECSYTNDDVKNYLIALGYSCESDCTAFAEFTGRRYSGLKGLSTILKRLDVEAMDGNFSTADRNGFKIGTHLNISKNVGGYNLVYKYSSELCNYSKSIRRSLSDFLFENPDICEYFFGRKIGEWADKITDCTSYSAHAVFLNFQHIDEGENSSRLEWRICKYIAGERGKENYFRAVETCQKLTDIILKGCEKIRNTPDGMKKAVAVSVSEKCVEYLRKEYRKAHA